MAAAAPQKIGPSNLSRQVLGQLTPANSTVYARYVGRVGALAVALGVGVAIATGGTGLARADSGSTG
jgi:hypothetical protein